MFLTINYAKLLYIFCTLAREAYSDHSGVRSTPKRSAPFKTNSWLRLRQSLLAESWQRRGVRGQYAVRSSARWPLMCLSVSTMRPVHTSRKCVTWMWSQITSAECPALPDVAHDGQYQDTTASSASVLGHCDAKADILQPKL